MCTTHRDLFGIRRLPSTVDDARALRTSDCMSDQTSVPLLETLKQARVAVSLWCDDVRADAEQRLGVAAGDAAAVDDGKYAAALDVWGHVHAAAAALEAWPGENSPPIKTFTPPLGPRDAHTHEYIRHPNPEWSTHHVCRLCGFATVTKGLPAYLIVDQPPTNSIATRSSESPQESDTTASADGSRHRSPEAEGSAS